MDLHAGQVQGFFRVPVDHMTALPMFAQYFRDKGLPLSDLVVRAPCRDQRDHFTLARRQARPSLDRRCDHCARG
jgi:phosphoribosylpyrophosphate synthetase